MIRMLAAFVVAAVTVAGARAGDIAWTDDDKAEIAKLAKKAKKTGDLFTLVGEVFETRLPTREAAAEFFLYFERLGQRVRLLWGTPDNVATLVVIGICPPNEVWPKNLKGHKIFFQRYFKVDSKRPTAMQRINSLNLWIDAAIKKESLNVSEIGTTYMNEAGMGALLGRLGGVNEVPSWITHGMLLTFQSWSPASTESPRPLLLDVRDEKATSRMARHIQRNDPVATLMPWFGATPTKNSIDRGKVDGLVMGSFFVFLLEHERGHEIFVDACKNASRGKPDEVDEKAIGKLVPHWLKWAGLEIVPAK